MGYISITFFSLFEAGDKYLKRSGLDYWDIANIQYYDSFEEVVE